MSDENGRPTDADGVSEWDGLDPLKAKFVTCLMEGDTMEEAAVKVGRAPRTLRTWRSEPEVQAACRQVMSEAIFRARAILTSGAMWASRSLVEIASGAVSADAPRVQACNSILDRLVSLAQYQELEYRIAAIEAKLGEGAVV